MRRPTDEPLVRSGEGHLAPAGVESLPAAVLAHAPRNEFAAACIDCGEWVEIGDGIIEPSGGVCEVRFLLRCSLCFFRDYRLRAQVESDR